MTWQQFYAQFINQAPGLLSVALRLLCAMIVGSLIGMEREYTHRPAGLRTHILVALGACVVSILGEMIFVHYSALGANPDPARLSAQVVTGVGFLGAGTIMKEGVNVKGLTTAASVWAVACLGIAAGFGYYSVALLGMLFTLITLTFLETLQRKLLKKHSTENQYIVHTLDVALALEQIHAAAQHQQVTLLDMATERVADGYEIRFRARFFGQKNEKHSREFFAALACAESVRSVNNTAEMKV